MKKLLIVTMMFLFSSCIVLADDKEDVLATFNRFVDTANLYEDHLVSFYAQNTKIYRIVNKKIGGQEVVVIPFDRYVQELRNHKELAKKLEYKNTYKKIKIKKHKNEYILEAIRIPRNDTKGLPCSFVFAKQDDVWKIKEERMTTDMQIFLNQK